MSTFNVTASVNMDNAVLARFRQLAELSAQEIDVLDGLSHRGRSHAAHTELCREGSVQRPLMLLSGWACYQRVLGDGRRQIIQILVPGDAIGSLSRPSLPAPCSAVALTPVLVTDARPLLDQADGPGMWTSGLAAAIEQVSQVEAVSLCDQIVRIGRQTAYERLVHLILELQGRLQAVGMGSGSSFPMPLTQEILADALGLSVVHVNRTLQQLRRDQLLDMRRGRVTLHRPEAMHSLADREARAAA